MGHSVGEIAAMCVAGGVTLEDGLKLISARGRLMQALPTGGAMASVMADEARVRAAIAGFEQAVAIAAVNAPGQTVISGSWHGAGGSSRAAEGQRHRHQGAGRLARVPLAADGADDRGVRARGALDSLLDSPAIPLVSCVDGQPATAELLSRRSIGCVRCSSRCGSRPGCERSRRTASRCASRSAPIPCSSAWAANACPDESRMAWLPSVRRDVEPWQTLLGSLAEGYRRGLDIDWAAFDAPYSRRRVQAPAYAFAVTRYWVKQSRARMLSTAARRRAGTRAGRRAAHLRRRMASGDPRDRHRRGRPSLGGHGRASRRTQSYWPRRSRQAGRSARVEPLHASKSLWAGVRSAHAAPCVVYVASGEERADATVRAVVELVQSALRSSLTQPSVWVVTRDAVQTNQGDAQVNPGADRSLGAGEDARARVPRTVGSGRRCAGRRGLRRRDRDRTHQPGVGGSGRHQAPRPVRAAPHLTSRYDAGAATPGRRRQLSRDWRYRRSGSARGPVAGGLWCPSRRAGEQASGPAGGRLESLLSKPPGRVSLSCPPTCPRPKASRRCSLPPGAKVARYRVSCTPPAWTRSRRSSS